MKIDPAELANLSPFPGLRPFSQKEADRFFGRGKHIAELAAMLQTVRFIAVSGTSGCGKSSLVRAGLLDTLQKSSADPAVAVKWRTALLRPGGRPIFRLAQALVEVLWPRRSDDEALTLYGELSLGGLGLVDMVRRARLAQNERLLVVVDQFEEVFRFRQLPEAKTLRDTTTPLSLDEATAFVKLLLSAAEERGGRISVVITLRSDTLGGTEEFRGLPEAINRGLYMVPRLTRDQRRQAIVAPVEALGFQVAPSLVQRLLNDVSDSFDDLPVMQHVLSRTWRQWCLASGGARPIELGDYEADAVGTARHALSIHADEAFHELQAKGLGTVVEKVFRALTERAGHGRGLRRPLPFDTLCEVVGAPTADVAAVVERYRRGDTAFLTPASEVPLASNPVIDISHESLMRQWKRLNEWATAEHVARTVLLRLCDAAERKAELWRGRELEEALEWERHTAPSAPWVGLCLRLPDGSARWQSAQRFLENSKAAAERTRRERRLLMGSLYGLTASTVLVLAVALVLELRSAVRVRADELTIRAQLLVTTDPVRAALMARRALALHHDSPRAERVIRDSVATLETAHPTKVIPFTAPVSGIERSSDRTSLAVASGKEVALLDAVDFKAMREPLTLASNVRRAWPVLDGRTLLTWTDARQGGVKLHGPGQSAAEDLSCGRDAGAATALALRPDANQVAIACKGEGIVLWSLGQQPPVREVLPPPRSSPARNQAPIKVLAYSPDGRYLASGDSRGGVWIWKPGVKDPWLEIPLAARGKDEPPRGAIGALSFHRGAGHDWLGVASDNHFATKLPLDLDARHMPEELAGRHAYDHDRPVAMARFFVRQDGSQSLMTVSDKRIWFWEDGKQRQVRRHDDVINSAEPSPDGEFAVSGSDDGTARVWSTRGRAAVAELRGHHDAVTSAQFGRNETEVITGSRDATVVVWSVRPQKLIWSKVNRWALSATVGPDGQIAVVCGEPLGSLVDSHACDLVPLQARAASGLSMVDVLRDGTNTVNQVSWRKDGHLLLGRYALGGEPRGRVAVWTDVGRDVTPQWLNDWVSATFVENTNEILTVGTDRLGLWPASALNTDREPPKLLDLAVKGVYLAAISPDGQWIAAASEPDNEVTLARRGAEARPVPLGRHGGQIKSVQFSHDGKWFVTTSNDRTARVWSTEAPEDVVRLEGGHRAGLSFGSFSPDGRRVVTSSADNTVRAWDARSGRELVSLEWHREGVNEVHFLADGRSLLTASDDGSVKVGECNACVEELGDIVKRIENLAVMPDTEAKALQRELDEVTPWFLRWFEPLLSR